MVDRPLAISRLLRRTLPILSVALGLPASVCLAGLFSADRVDCHDSTEALILAGAEPGLTEAERLRSLINRLNENGACLCSSHAQVALSRAIGWGSPAERAEAADLAREAVALQRELLAPNDLDLDESLHRLGKALFTIGRHDESYRAFLDQLDVLEARGDPPPNELAQVLDNVAACAGLTGRFRVARECSERASELIALHDPGSLAHVMNLGNLGALLDRLGDRYAALDATQSAIEMLEARPVVNRTELARLKSNLGYMLIGIRQPERAAIILREAASLREALDLQPDASLTKLQLALAWQKAGRLQEAEDLTSTVAGLFVQHLGPKHPVTARARLQLGRIYRETGELDRAEEQYRLALAAVDHLDQAHSRMVAPLGELARVLAALGQGDEALSLSLRAARVERENVIRNAATMAPAEAVRYESFLRSGLAAALTVAREQDLKDVWDAVVKRRGLVVDELSHRRRALALDRSPDVVRLRQDLSLALRHLNQAIAAGLGDEASERRVLAARERQEEIERELAAKSLAHRRHVGRRQVGLEEVLEALVPGHALVAYVRYPMPKQASAHAVFVHAPGWSEPRLIRLGDATRIDRLVADWHAALRAAPGRGGDAERAERSYRHLGARLREAVWDPIAASLPPTEGIFVVPDGALQLLSLATLPVGEDRYLVEVTSPIHYLATERDLVRDDAVGTGEGLLVVGAPDFGSKLPRHASRRDGEVHRSALSRCEDLASLEFGSLPGARYEAREVTQSWRRRSDEPVLLLTGAEANEGAVKRAMPGRRVIHLATHGFVLGADCVASSTSLDARQLVQGEGAMSLAGLALAGATHRGRAGLDAEDGILTAEEISAMDLTAADLVVLSACDTGVGRVFAGEGAFGLRRAFQVAGARTLVMSLFPANDRATREWMKEFHEERWGNRRSTMASAQSASLALLQARRERGLDAHPSRWGSFVASGDWR